MHVTFKGRHLTVDHVRFSVSVIVSLAVDLLSSSVHVDTSIAASTTAPFAVTVVMPLPPYRILLLAVICDSPLLKTISSVRVLSPVFSKGADRSSTYRDSSRSQ